MTVVAAKEKRLYQIAFALAVFTIVYNLLEGVISTYFGHEDGSLTLFGFGIDSFIEVISGVGIANMIIRIQIQTESQRSQFERNALRITGFSFYGLVAGLIATAAYNVYVSHKPDTTWWGLIISVVSILAMSVLIYAKKKVGKQLKSEPILADARCTLVCIYMSIILLVSSAVYELTSFLYVDVIGTLGLAYFSFREGKECFEKAESNKNCSCDHHETLV